MPHNEARELLVQGYETTHDAEGIAKAYSVSKWTVYRLVGQKRKTGTVALRQPTRTQAAADRKGSVPNPYEYSCLRISTQRTSLLAGSSGRAG